MVRTLATSLLAAITVVMVLLWVWLLNTSAVRRGVCIVPAAPARHLPTIAAYVHRARPTLLSRSNRPRSDAQQRSTGPETCARFLSSPPDNADAAREWARSDPARALLWLPHAAPGAARDAVVEIGCSEVVEFDPAEAVSIADEYSPDNINLLENLIQRWSTQSETAAAMYADRKPAGVVRDRLLSRVAFADAKTNPVTAARLVAQDIAPGTIQDEAAISVLHQWALQDPAAALLWAESFPPGSLRDRAIREVHALLPDATSHLALSHAGVTAAQRDD